MNEKEPNGKERVHSSKGYLIPRNKRNTFCLNFSSVLRKNALLDTTKFRFASPIYNSNGSRILINASDGSVLMHFNRWPYAMEKSSPTLTSTNESGCSPIMHAGVRFSCYRKLKRRERKNDSDLMKSAKLWLHIIHFALIFSLRSAQRTDRIEMV